MCPPGRAREASQARSQRPPASRSKGPSASRSAAPEEREPYDLHWPPAEVPEPSLEEKPLVLLGCAGEGFASAPPRTLLWDGSRRSFAFHWPGFLVGQANRIYYLEALREVAPWQEVIGPSGDVSRSTCWYVRGRCKCDYTYGSERVGAAKAGRREYFTQIMEDLTQRVFTLACPTWPREAWPNSASLNLYLNDSQSVGWHSDDESLFQGKEDDCIIVSLSLGARREFWMALKRQGTEPENRVRAVSQSVLEVDLEDGDLMSMEGLCQKHCIHFVPGGSRLPALDSFGQEVDAPTGGVRINISWRWIRDHKRKCPMARSAKSSAQCRSSLPRWAQAISMAQGPQDFCGFLPPACSRADAAQHWLTDAQVMWRRCCEGCRWRSGRNCTRHRGRWLCRLCLQSHLSRHKVGSSEDPAEPSQEPLPVAHESLPAVPMPLFPPFPPLPLNPYALPPIATGGELPGLALALQNFDGAILGDDCLMVAQGTRLVLLPNANAGPAWAYGAPMACDPGWFPADLLGEELPHPLVGQARDDFDGGIWGTEYLTVVKGATLARLSPSDLLPGWLFGVMLVEPQGWFPTGILG